MIHLKVCVSPVWHLFPLLTQVYCNGGGEGKNNSSVTSQNFCCHISEQLSNFAWVIMWASYSNIRKWRSQWNASWGNLGHSRHRRHFLYWGYIDLLFMSNKMTAKKSASVNQWAYNLSPSVGLNLGYFPKASSPFVLTTTHLLESTMEKGIFGSLKKMSSIAEMNVS